MMPSTSCDSLAQVKAEGADQASALRILAAFTTADALTAAAAGRVSGVGEHEATRRCSDLLAVGCLVVVGNATNSTGRPARLLSITAVGQADLDWGTIPRRASTENLLAELKAAAMRYAADTCARNADALFGAAKAWAKPRLEIPRVESDEERWWGDAPETIGDVTSGSNERLNRLSEGTVDDESTRRGV